MPIKIRILITKINSNGIETSVEVGDEGCIMEAKINTLNRLPTEIIKGMIKYSHKGLLFNSIVPTYGAVIKSKANRGNLSTRNNVMFGGEYLKISGISQSADATTETMIVMDDTKIPI
jgi:hypothetical protein